MDANNQFKSQREVSADNFIPINSSTLAETDARRQTRRNEQKLNTRFKRFRRYSRRSLIITVTSIAALLLITGGSYALYFGPHNSATDSSSSAVNLGKGLVGYWKLNGNANDSTPYGNNGTVNGATPTTGQEGQANGAYSFNGSSAYISAPAPHPLSSITVSEWFQRTGSGTGGYGRLLGWQGYDFEIADNEGNLAVYTPGMGWKTTSQQFGTGWNNIVVSANGTNVYVYFDGQQIDTYSSTLSLSTGTIYFGKPYSSTGYVQGSLSDVRIYNRVLSQAEITALYNEAGSGINADSGENGLTGWWKLNGNANDSTPYGDNGTVNGATLTTDRLGAANSAYSFNGTSSYISMSNSVTLGAGTSIGLWVKTTYSGFQAPFVSNRNGPGNIYFGINGGRLFLYDNGGSPAGVTTTTTLDDGNWHYVVVTMSGSSTVLYIDGTATTVSQTTNSASGTLDLGYDQSTGDYFPGSMSDVRIYNRVLSTADVSALYHSYNSQIELGGSGQNGSVSLGSGLVGSWPLNGNTKDATPYSNNFTLGSGTSYTTDRFGQANSSLSFPSSSAIAMTGSNNLAPFSTTALSVNLWLDLTSYGTYYAVQPLMKGTCGAATDTFCFYIFGNYDGNNDQGQIRFYGGDAGVWNVLSGGYTINTGQWYMISLVYTSTAGGQLYVNGAPVGSPVGSGALGSNTSPVDGVFQGGNLNDLRVYNRALDVAEIQALYREGE